jgi:hypothetical protein
MPDNRRAPRVSKGTLPDSQLIHLLKRRAAAPADNGGTVAADQGICYRQVASRTIQLDLRFAFLVGHYCYTSSRNCCS